MGRLEGKVALITKDRPAEFEKLCEDVSLGYFGDATTEIGARPCSMQAMTAVT